VAEYSGKVAFHEKEPYHCYPGIWVSSGKSEDWRRLSRIGFRKSKVLKAKIEG
jgi:hypothetical protein